MPSIAQQDYIVIKPNSSRAALSDAECLSKLKLACLNKTIFDCLVFDPFITGEDCYNRVISASLEGPADSFGVTVYDAGDAEFKTQLLEYTVAQYQGLAAIQQAIDEKYRLMLSLPSLETDGGTYYLYVVNPSTAVCVDGKCLIVTGSDTIEAIEIAETGPGESEPFVNITWEDAQKLIGLPHA